MNKYLLPVCSLDDIWIESVSAKNFNDAKDKFIESLGETYDWVTVDDWDKFLEECADHELFIGDIYDLEEF